MPLNKRKAKFIYDRAFPRSLVYGECKDFFSLLFTYFLGDNMAGGRRIKVINISVIKFSMTPVL